MNRREFTRVAVLGGLALSGCSTPSRRSCAPIKISLQIPSDFTDDDLVFARQLGVEYVSIPTKTSTYETFVGFKKRVEAAGLQVANIGRMSVHNMEEVTLNLPGRDRKIEE